MRIVLCYPVESRHLGQIAAAAPRAEIVDAGQEYVARELLAADVFCGHAKGPSIGTPWWPRAGCGGCSLRLRGWITV